MDFIGIIKNALEQARRIKCSPSEFREGLKTWKEEIDEEIDASAETDTSDEDE